MTTADPPNDLRRRRGQPLLAWLAIALAVGTAFGAQLKWSNKVESRKEATNAMQDLQGRDLVAAGDLDRGQGAKAFRDQSPPKDGTDLQRLHYVVLAGELVGPDEALKQLRELGPYPEQEATAAQLEKLYEDYREKQWTAPALSDADRQELGKQLGWFGELALVPREGPDANARSAVLQPARLTFYILLGAVLGFFALGGCGFILLVAVLLLVGLGLARLHFRTGSPNGAIYAETFALWMWLFMGLGLGASFLPVGNNRLLVASLCSLASLSVLAWPVFRGVPWQTVRREVGLFWSDRPEPLPLPPPSTEREEAYFAGHPFRPPMVRPPVALWPAPAFLEPVFGVGSYLATLPLLFVGALLTLGLMQLKKAAFGVHGDPFGLGADPSHPIAGFLTTANWWGRAQVIFAASVGAPIVEETMFRGVLYRHLREVVGRWGRLWAVLASAAVVSFVFAVIHPQGIMGVPALMSLAIGFSLAREWRGTLVPSMVAHGLNNLMVTVLLLVSMG